MGAYLAVISGAIKLFNYIAAALQQHHDELNGANAQKVATNDATNKVLGDVSRPATVAERDKLWADNEQKFGANGKPGGQ